MRGDLTGPERRLRFWLIAHAVLSVGLACNYLIAGDTSTLTNVPNSFAKDALFVALSVIAAADVRRFGGLTLMIVLGYVALVAGEAVTLSRGGAEPLTEDISATLTLLGWMAIDVALIALFTWLWVAAVRGRHGLRYLHPVAFLSLAALADVLIEGEREVVPPRQVARNVDGYLADLRASRKRDVQVALIVLCVWPLLTARPPLPLLAPATRKRFLEKRFLEEDAVPRLVRRYVRVLIRTGSQMAYLGYYGDPDSWESIGYTPFRLRRGGRPPRPVDHRHPPLASLKRPPRERFDTVVVGSGAAGGILAHRFAATGRDVLVIERGPHVDPRDFGDDEVTQYLRLYNEGALQLATDFELQVLQGVCVGGGTTINNALCMSPPEPVLVEWEKRGLDRAALKQAIEEIRRELEVTQIPRGIATVAARRFERAAHDLDLPGTVELMDANIAGCLGIGYCNIGCGYGAKLTALDITLAKAQRRHGVKVLPDVEVERIDRAGERATRIVGTHACGERVAIEAAEIVVAAGAIGSSRLLQRSGIGGEAVGHGLNFNINTPITAEFRDQVDSFAGIQMSHAYRAPGAVPDYLVETWFNPPATQALAMPGWFHRHFENMRRYRRMACAGVLVGTTTPGRVKPSRDGPQIEYTPADGDRRRLVDGLEVAGRIWLEAGAERVMPATFAFREYRSAKALGQLPRHARESGDLLLTSAHPQGGNALGEVVDENFRVRGFENLYLCDASVFPSSVHVNPQLTVMGMAQYAANRILR